MINWASSDYIIFSWYPPVWLKIYLGGKLTINPACFTYLDLLDSALLLLDLLLLLLSDSPALGGRGVCCRREVAPGDVGRPQGDGDKGQAYHQCSPGHHVRNWGDQISSGGQHRDHSQCGLGVRKEAVGPILAATEHHDEAKKPTLSLYALWATNSRASRSHSQLKYVLRHKSVISRKNFNPRAVTQPSLRLY